MLFYSAAYCDVTGLVSGWLCVGAAWAGSLQQRAAAISRT